MAAPNGRVDQATWDKLLEAYRQDPGNHSAASRHALVQRRTARKAWDEGYPDRPWGTKPIKQLIAEDRELAGARAQLEAEREGLAEDVAELESERDREAARQRAIVVKKEEAVLVQLARQSSIRTLAAAVTASEGLKTIMTKIGAELETMGKGGPLTKKELLDVSNITRRYASTLREVVTAGQMAMEMERLYMGEPTEIIGVTTELDALPLPELVKMAGYQDGVLKRAAERGLVVLEGGQSKKQA